jgi:hypothetical protein
MQLYMYIYTLWEVKTLRKCEKNKSLINFTQELVLEKVDRRLSFYPLPSYIYN